MNKTSEKDDILEQLKNRMGEVAEHRAARWLEELDKATDRPPKERILARMNEVTETLARKWLNELDARLGWTEYQKDHEDFCYGVSFGEHRDCKSLDKPEECPNFAYCKAEHEADWAGKKSAS